MGYYWWFVKNYGKLDWPLTDCLRKGSFFWDELAKQAFQSLKRVMTELLVLALPDFFKEFVVEADAFGYSLGAILMPEQRPIAFFSHSLNPKG